MFLRLGTDSGRWKVNLNEVSYFKMSGAGKMDLPDGSPCPLADNAVGAIMLTLLLRSQCYVFVEQSSKLSHEAHSRVARSSSVSSQIVSVTSGLFVYNLVLIITITK